MTWPFGRYALCICQFHPKWAHCCWTHRCRGCCLFAAAPGVVVIVVSAAFTIAAAAIFAISFRCDAIQSALQSHSVHLNLTPFRVQCFTFVCCSHARCSHYFAMFREESALDRCVIAANMADEKCTSYDLNIRAERGAHKQPNTSSWCGTKSDAL